MVSRINGKKNGLQLTESLLIILAEAMIEMGESLRQMADVKYALDDNIKQNFLEPLHHLQTKDLKEVMVGFISFHFTKFVVV